MIKKWPIDVGETRIPWRFGMKVLHVGVQYQRICVWTDDSRIPSSAPEMDYVFYVIPTGMDSVPCQHHGTVMIRDDTTGMEFMWHVFGRPDMKMIDDTDREDDALREA